MDKVKQKPSEISVIQLQPKNFSGFRYYFCHKILNITDTGWESHSIVRLGQNLNY